MVSEKIQREFLQGHNRAKSDFREYLKNKEGYTIEDGLKFFLLPTGNIPPNFIKKSPIVSGKFKENFDQNRAESDF